MSDLSFLFDFREEDLEEGQFDLDLDLTDDSFWGVEQWNPLDFIPQMESKKVLFTADTLPVVEQDAKPYLKRGMVLTDQQDTIKGMEVGDDRVDISKSVTLLMRELSIQERVLKMRTSKEDTFITDDVWNFCEVTSIVPMKVEGSFDFLRKTGNRSHLDFIDCPILRIVVDVSKSDRSHSSSAVGKASMMASRLSLNRTGIRETLGLSSIFQDCCLATWKMSDPKYLPKEVGGSGSPPPFWRNGNTYSYVLGYKTGTYERVYATAIAEIRNVVRELDRGIPSQPLLSSRLREKQKFLHGTYENKVMVPPRRPLALEVEDVVPVPIYMDLGTEAFSSSVENRLMRTRVLESRESAEISIMQINRIRKVLSGHFTLKELDRRVAIARDFVREQYGNVVNANAAFQRLLNRAANGTEVGELLQAGYGIVTTGKLIMEVDDLNWIINGGFGEIFSIKDIRKTSDMYIHDEVSIEEHLRVSEIPLRPVGTGTLPRFTVTKIGLYQIGKSMEQWSENLISSLRSIPERPVPRDAVLRLYADDPEWINDDSLLVKKAIDYVRGKPSNTAIFLFSSDKKLGGKIASTIHGCVVRYEPVDLVTRFPDREWSSTSVINREDLKVFDRSLQISQYYEPCVLIDTGSLTSAASSFETGEIGKVPVFYRKTPTVCDDLNRINTYICEPQQGFQRPPSQVHLPPGMAFPQRYLFDNIEKVMTTGLAPMSYIDQTARYGRSVYKPPRSVKGPRSVMSDTTNSSY